MIKNRIGQGQTPKSNFLHTAAWALLPAAVVLTCTDNTGPKFEPQPVIFAVLNPGNPMSQQIWVDQTYGIEDSVSQFGVDGAQVTVTGIGYTAHFLSVGDGLYLGNPILKPDSDYILQVILTLAPKSTPDTVWATTKVPGIFHITTPRNHDTLDRNDLPRLVWTPSEGREYYHVWIFPASDTSHLDSLPFYYRIPQSLTDTVLDLSTLRTYFAWHDTTYVFRVMASEENYYHYLRQDAGPNLSQGFGVFGADADDSVKVYVK